MSRGPVRLPSPAMLVALAALFVALGGTSYAALTLPANSVGNKQLKKSAVTSSKIKSGAVTKKKLNLAGVTAPNASALGGLPASGYQQHAMWALVSASGGIIEQSGGVSVETHPFTGGYYLHFPKRVQGKAVMASASELSEANGVGVVAGPCDAASGPDAVDCGAGTNDANDAYVETYYTNSTAAANEPFYIAVLP